MLDRIEKWCKENNTTIAALEKKCGLGNATIRGWNTCNPRMDTLAKVAEVTNIPIVELIQFKNKEELHEQLSDVT